MACCGRAWQQRTPTLAVGQALYCVLALCVLWSSLFDVGAVPLVPPSMHVGSLEQCCALTLLCAVVQVKEVTEYRRQVYALVRKVLEAAPDPAASSVGWEDPAWAVFMGFEHERIHIETSTVLIRELPLECVKEPQWVRCRSAFTCRYRSCVHARTAAAQPCRASATAAVGRSALWRGVGVRGWHVHACGS